MPTSFSDIEVQPGWNEKLETAKKNILRLAAMYGLSGWKTGGCYTDNARKRWNQYYNTSFSSEHRHIIYDGITNTDFAIWLETELIQWSQGRKTGVKQDEIAVLNGGSGYSADRTGCVYIVGINEEMYGHIIL